MMTQLNSLPSINTTAIELWQLGRSLGSADFIFKAQDEPCFLLSLIFETDDQSHASRAHDVLTIAMSEQACFSAQGLTAISLWEMASNAVCNSPCHVYLNLDLLTIDEHAQDWGDFKIKPEQVEVQRNELTHAALFNPRLGFLVQVLKSSLPTLMTMLREAKLESFSATIGKTWGQVETGQAVLDIYRDAKKQLSFSAQDLLELKNKATTK
jgi:hypothetical protein